MMIIIMIFPITAVKYAHFGTQKSHIFHSHLQSRSQRAQIL